LFYCGAGTAAVGKHLNFSVSFLLSSCIHKGIHKERVMLPANLQLS
jgi:hypothetical protein